MGLSYRTLSNEEQCPRGKSHFQGSPFTAAATLVHARTSILSSSLSSTVHRTFGDDGMFCIHTVYVVATSHMWLLSACNVVSVVNSEERNY